MFDMSAIFPYLTDVWLRVCLHGENHRRVAVACDISVFSAVHLTQHLSQSDVFVVGLPHYRTDLICYSVFFLKLSD